MKFKIKLMKFRIRLSVAYKILFRKYDHWMILNVDKANLEKLLKEEDFEADMVHHGTVQYVNFKMMKMICESKDDVDMILDKASFEAEADIHHSNKKK